MILETAIFWKFSKICISITEFAAKEITQCRATNFLNEVLHQI